MPFANTRRSSRSLVGTWSCLALPALVLALSLGCGGKHGSSMPPPTFSSYTPTLGEASSQVVVYGTGLGEGLSGVSFGGIQVPLSTVTVGLITYSPDPIVGNTSVSFAVPFNAVTGPIVVATPGGAITTPDFIVIPAISSVTPASGSLAAGTPVTVAGYGLKGITSILFGGVAATPTSTTANEIIVPLPAGAPQGPVQITFVANPTYQLPDLQWSFTVNP